MLKVYLVDDEQIIIDELLEVIDWEKCGYKVCGFANDSETAMKEIENLKPDVIICDISMGELNGLQLSGWILRKYPETGIVFLTAYDNFGYAVEAVSLHALAYLMKPVRTEELVRVLKDFRRRRFQNVFSRMMEFALIGGASDRDIRKAEKDIRENDLLSFREKYFFVVCGEEAAPPPEAIAHCRGEGKLLLLMEEKTADVSLFSGRIHYIGRKFCGGENIFRHARESVQEYENAARSRFSETEVVVVLKQMLEDIEQNYGNKISLSMYAGKYHYNTSYLSEQFKAYVGMTFIDYLVKTRFEKAKVLMRDSDMSMNEIAERVGYEDYSHFSKLFKKHEGYSPVEYRKNFC